MDVVMTRDTDVFIPLEERTAIANREGADLFLSIHANASRNIKARGIETYFLNFADQPRSGSRGGARELSVRPDHAPPAGHRAGHHAQQQDRRVARLRRDRAEVDGAQAVEPNRELKDCGVKQAPFVVLIGAGMPSVLAEIRS